MQNEFNNQDLLRRAYAAYFRKNSGDGVPIQPSKDSDVEIHNGKHYVVLRNVNGPLHVYRVRNDGILKTITRWPADIK